jgi:type VI secretion system protein VasI
MRYLAPRILTLLITATGMMNIAAQPNVGSLQKCVSLDNDVQRLSCFDEATKSLRPSKVNQRGAGRWKFEREVSRVDDSKTFVASVDANEQITGWPRKVYRPTLILRCKENRLSVYIDVGMAAHVESADGSVSLTLRLDQEEAFGWEATRSTDGEALFLQDAENLILKLGGKRKMLFRFTPFNSSPAIASFDIRGVESAITGLQETCKS